MKCLSFHIELYYFMRLTQVVRSLTQVQYFILWAAHDFRCIMIRMFRQIKTLIWVLKLQYTGNRHLALWRAFFSVEQGLTPVLGAYIVAQMLAEVASIATGDSGNPTYVYVLLAMLALIAIVSELLAELDRLIARRHELYIDLQSNKVYYEKLYELSQEQFEDEAFNTKLSRGQEGLHSLSSVSRDLEDALTSLVGLLSSATAIIVISPLIGGMIVISIIPAAIIGMKQNKFMEKAYRDSDPYARIAYRSRWYLINPQDMVEVRLANAFSDLAKSWRKNAAHANSIEIDAEKKSFRARAIITPLEPVIEFLANLLFFNQLLAGALGLDRFLFVRNMLQQASGSASSMAYALERMHRMSVNLDNFIEIQETPPAIPVGSQPIKPPLTIEFRDVSFTYPGKRVEVLKHVSFTLKPNDRVAIVGENGAGKTTIIKLLLRQYLPTSGEIYVNGISIREINPSIYYDYISNLSQNFLIYTHLTIKENVTIGLSRRASNDDVADVLQQVGAESFVEELKHGINQRLDTSFEDGITLSGGQMQRIGIARALLRRSDLIILDEPTSAIDAKGEAKIFANIYDKHKGATALIVSHRFSTVRKASHIIVMDNGGIIEQGSHDELIEHDGLYKEMFDKQAEGYR